MEETERQDDSARVSGEAEAMEATWWIISSRVPRVVSLRASGTVLGREPEDLGGVSFDDPRMSRRHAEIGADQGGWYLRDLGSRNGGFIEGAVIAPRASSALKDGALLRIGNTIGVFRTQPAGAPDPSARTAFPGWSIAAQAVRSRIANLAAATGHVLVVGETGVGKESVSRAIAGQRRVVVVNCAELRRDLVRSELFGHARGAFSGAVTSHGGLVDEAASGALLLDEIGELPLDAQADLLRFLEDGSYRPVGSSDLHHSDARIIAATNRDLDAHVRSGAFRRDLLARLRAANRPLAVPALAERREDVISWASRFVHEALGHDPSCELWSPGAVECLSLYMWPDNLRELRGLVRGALETRHGWPLRPEHLPGAVVRHRQSLRGEDLSSDDRQSARADEPNVAEVEGALTQSSGNMKLAAQLLRIDRRKLYRLCEQLGIEIEPFRKGDRDGV